MNVEVTLIGQDQIKQFIDFPHDLYKGDPNYVPEIFLAMKDHLNPKKNPYFKHSDAAMFLAKKGDKIVGRIAVTVNNNYNDFHNCKVGWFGFFDCIEDVEVSNKLFKTAEQYLKDKNIHQILGPANFTTNDTAAFLVDGFDSPPLVQMTYNKPYYGTFAESFGFTKEMDMFAYMIKTDKVNQKALNLADRLEARLQTKGITLRNVKKKDWAAEVNRIREIYKSAWEKNWGFVPPTNDEFDFLAEGLKLVVDERYAYIAEKEGKCIGFAVGLPNINEIMIKSNKGRLLPFTIFNLLMNKYKTKYVRIILLGVLEQHRKLGIEAVFYSKFIAAAKANGLIGGEASWILESNQDMCLAAENLHGEKYKTYRIYTKSIS
ncbi:MAG: hypothetical protein IPN72_12545 [Saprospiraceae bacterium]|nr:hypothetical protein [Saprospiraceae bacterium]